MNKIERPHFIVCEKKSDHGHFIIPNKKFSSLPFYCKQHALIVLPDLIQKGVISQVQGVALLQDINICNLPNTETPEVREKINNLRRSINFILQHLNVFDKSGICQN